MGGKVPSVKHDLRTNVAANKDHSISCRISSWETVRKPFWHRRKDKGTAQEKDERRARESVVQNKRNW